MSNSCGNACDQDLLSVLEDLRIGLTFQNFLQELVQHPSSDVFHRTERVPGIRLVVAGRICRIMHHVQDREAGIDTPRIWTAARDKEMWEALQG